MGLLKVMANSMSGNSWFDHTHYLMLLSKVVGTDQYLCIYGIPFRFKKKYAESFEGAEAEEADRGVRHDGTLLDEVPPVQVLALQL